MCNSRQRPSVRERMPIIHDDTLCSARAQVAMLGVRAETVVACMYHLAELLASPKMGNL